MHISTNDLHCCKPARMLQLAAVLRSTQVRVKSLLLYLNIVFRLVHCTRVDCECTSFAFCTSCTC